MQRFGLTTCYQRYIGHDRNDMPNRKCRQDVKNENTKCVQLAMAIWKLVQELSSKELSMWK